MSESEEGAPSRSSDDAGLVARVVEGDTRAFDELYRRHVGGVIRSASRRCRGSHEVAEVVADTFVAVWRRASTYQPDCGTVEQWIAGIGAGAFLDVRRRERRHRRLAQRAQSRVAVDNDAFDALIDRLDAARGAPLAREAVADLPASQRVVFELVVIDGLTVSAAATALGMSPAAVSMRLTRARRTIARPPTTPDPTPVVNPGATP